MPHMNINVYSPTEIFHLGKYKPILNPVFSPPVISFFNQVELTHCLEGRNPPSVSVLSADEPAAAGSSLARLNSISASTGTVPSPRFHMSPACLLIICRQTSPTSSPWHSLFFFFFFLHFLTLKSARWQLYEAWRAVDIHLYCNSCLL